MTKLNTPFSSDQASSACPVSRQNAWKSATEARSVASTRSRSPGAIVRSARLARSTGIGQVVPFMSSRDSLITGILRRRRKLGKTARQASLDIPAELIELCQYQVAHFVLDRCRGH